MTTDDKIWDETLQYDINREAAKLSPLSSGKTDKYEYLTAEEILSSNRRQLIEQGTFAYSPLRSFRKTNIKAGWCFKVPKSFWWKRWVKTKWGYISAQSDELYGPC